MTPAAGSLAVRRQRKGGSPFDSVLEEVLAVPQRDAGDPLPLRQQDRTVGVNGSANTVGSLTGATT